MSQPDLLTTTRRARTVAIVGVALMILATILFVVTEAAPKASAAPAQTNQTHTNQTQTTQAPATITLTPAQKSAANKAAAAEVAATAAAAERSEAAKHTVNVWTTGFQTQINECRGAVDVTAHYGVRTAAEHWNCGGSALPTTAGTLVTVTGLDAGTYRVVGVAAVLNAYTAHTSQIPRGYDLLLQTCRNNDSHTTEFIALTRVG